MDKICMKLSFLPKSPKIGYTSHVRDFWNSQMDKIRTKLSFLPKSPKIWYTSHVRVFQISQLQKICIKLSFLPKSPEIWYNIHVFGEMLQNSQKKNQSPHSFGWGPPNGDFDFFGEFHGITPKTPMYIYRFIFYIFFCNHYDI